MINFYLLHRTSDDNYMANLLFKEIVRLHGVLVMTSDNATRFLITSAGLYGSGLIHFELQFY